MKQDLKTELAELTRALKGWVQYQDDLGVRGFPKGKKLVEQGESEVIGTDNVTLEDIREEMGDCKACIELCDDRKKHSFRRRPGRRGTHVLSGKRPGGTRISRGNPLSVVRDSYCLK